MTGNILLNGTKRRLDYGVVAYVTQEDVLLGTNSERNTNLLSPLEAPELHEQAQDQRSGGGDHHGNGPPRLQRSADRELAAARYKRRREEPQFTLIVASLVPNFLMGIIAGAGVLGIMMMTAGFFRLLPDLPKIFWRYPISFIGYGAWSLQGGFKNDMLGLVFDPLFPGDPKITGEYVLTKMFGLSLDHSKWWDLSAVYALIIVCRFFFFVILKLKERVGPYLHSLYARRTAYRLQKRPSLRTTTSNVISLSSQEGLNSPIPH